MLLAWSESEELLGKLHRPSDPELCLEPRTVLRREFSLNQHLWRLQTTWMFSLVTHSLWQPIKTFVSAVTVINLSDTAPKSQFQRPLAAALLVPGEWMAQSCPSCRSCRGHGRGWGCQAGYCPSPRVPGVFPGRSSAAGRIRALEFLPSFPLQHLSLSPEFCCSTIHHSCVPWRSVINTKLYHWKEGEESSLQCFGAYWEAKSSGRDERKSLMGWALGSSSFAVSHTGLPGTPASLTALVSLGLRLGEICCPSVLLSLGCGKYYFLEDEAVYWPGMFPAHLFCCCCEFGLEASPSSRQLLAACCKDMIN